MRPPMEVAVLSRRPSSVPWRLPPADGIRQFQIAPRRAVERHVLLPMVNAKARDVLQRVLLRVAEVAHQRARRARGELHFPEAEHVQGSHLKVTRQRFFGARELKSALRVG